MSDVAIKAEGLGKFYKIQIGRKQSDTFRDALVEGVKDIGRNMGRLARGHITPGGPTEEFWALKDVDFEIRRGEAVGVIGRNGAGKSTLLKVLSRITEPSSGRVAINGRVASLLEVGTGFHPELTGRENIYLNGAIIGMTRAEIRRKFDEIVDFAGVDKFLDTPVKRYSSGMYVRLAFAVAAHLEPEILIVDEVLAVGDAEFQKKCLGKMEDVAGQGRTVLFVSHNLGAVQALCTRGILMKAGQSVLTAPIADVIDAYSGGFSGDAGFMSGRYVHNEVAKPDAPFRLREVRVAGENNHTLGRVSSNEKIVIEVSYEQTALFEKSRVVMFLRNEKKEILFTTTDDLSRRKIHSSECNYVSRAEIPERILLPGYYFIEIRVAIPHQQVLLRDLEVCGFVVEGPILNTGSRIPPPRWLGVVAPPVDWVVEAKEAESAE